MTFAATDCRCWDGRSRLIASDHQYIEFVIGEPDHHSTTQNVTEEPWKCRMVIEKIVCVGYARVLV